MKCGKCGAEGSGVYCAQCGEPLLPYTANTKGLFGIFTIISAFILAGSISSGNYGEAFFFAIYTIMEALAVVVAAKQWRRGRWYLKLASIVFGVIGYILVAKTFTKPYNTAKTQRAEHAAPSNPDGQK